MRQLKRLGTGMFDFPPQPSPYALGSGLFGQAAMPPDIQAPAGAGWISAEGGQGYGNGMPMDIGQPKQAPAGSSAAGEDKFTALLNNPMFQMGMNLLGASNQRNPWGTALQSTLAAQAQNAVGKRAEREAQLAERRLAQQAALAEQEHALAQQTAATNARNADIAQQRANQEQQQLEAQLPLWQAQAQSYGAQADLRGQEHQLAQRQFEQQQMLMQRLMPQLGGGLFESRAPQASPMSAPTGPAGRHGTPNWLLDGLSRTESSNNPKALGPVLPDGTRAEGMFQFRPSTTEMLRKQGIQFDPFDPQGSRDAADAYLQQLVQANGGDYSKALAAYGGFKTKDPTPYIRKVTGGQPLPGAQTTPPAQAPQGADPSVLLGQLGMAASVGGLKGGPQIMDYAKMLQPQAVAPGSFQRDPATGSLTQVPDPKGQRQLELEERRVQTTEAAESRQATKDTKEQQAKMAGVDTAYNNARMSLERLDADADALLKHPGLDVVSGWSGQLGLHKIPGAGKDAAARLESMKSKLVVNTLQELKKLSETGASGFGQLSDKEGARLESYVANLEAAQSEKQMREAIGNIQKFARESRAAHEQQYRSLRGGASSGGVKFLGFEE